mmetsp:Transcript_11751/g.14622  ORF Transcript_11751/g.14622 Transcript_11751/m.14622 type:complete len:109 (+) Transcript_11751:502-828(+)
MSQVVERRLQDNKFQLIVNSNIQENTNSAEVAAKSKEGIRGQPKHEASCDATTVDQTRLKRRRDEIRSKLKDKEKKLIKLKASLQQKTEEVQICSARQQQQPSVDDAM